ncbi:hypothetical protein Tco_0691518 [Tanacetum coccineum]
MAEPIINKSMKKAHSESYLSITNVIDHIAKIGEGKITVWEELVEKFFCKFYPDSYDGEDEMLDEGDNWGIDPLGFLSRVNSSFDKLMKIDGRTKKVLFHAGMNGNWNKRQIDNSILSSNNTTSDSFLIPNLKTHEKSDTRKEEEQSQTKRKYSNTSSTADEQHNKRRCKAEKFEAILYSLRPKEEYIAIRSYEYDIWERNKDNLSIIYQDVFKKKDEGWKDDWEVDRYGNANLGDLDNSTNNVLIPLDSWTSGLLVYRLPLSAKALHERPQVALSSNTEPNPREQVNSFMTRSGLTTTEPSIPPPVPPTPMVEVEKEPETLMEEVHITSPTSTAHVPPPGVQPVPPPKPKEDPKLNPHQPKIPYPSRLNKTKVLDKNDVQISKFLKILKQLHFDISLMDALTQILKFTKVLKDLLKDKKKLEELANTLINVECSTILLNKIPGKLEDPGKFLIPKFLIPIVLTDLRFTNSLARSGGMHKLCLFRSWRPFLGTARALVDLYEEKLTLRVGNEEVVDKPISGGTTFPSDSSPSSPLVETSDSHLEEFADELALLDPFLPRNKDDNFDPEADLREIEYLLNKDSSTVSSPMTNIDISDPIFDRFTDEPALVYSSPPGDDDDLFYFNSDNDEWKKLLYGDSYNDTHSKNDKTKDSKTKSLIDEANIVESTVLPPHLLTSDSTLPEESSESSEIATLLSFPFGNEDKVFNPGIFILGETQIFNNKSKDKDLKVNTSSEAFLILEERNFLSISSDCELLFFLELTVIETLLSFSSENDDKVFNPGILTSKGVHSFIIGLSHRTYETFKIINVHLNILNEGNQNYQAPPQVGPSNDLSSYMKTNDVNMRVMQNQISNMRTELKKEMDTTLSRQNNAFKNELRNDIKNMMSSIFQMNTVSSSGSGSLPSNTVANPRGDLKAITTRSALINEPVVAPNPKPFIPYPSRANKQKLCEKNDNFASKFVEIFRELHFELSFADALLHMPKFASMFKSLLNTKKKMLNLAKTPIVECLALANLGASINLMPLSIWKKLSLFELTPTRMILELADRPTTSPSVDDEAITFKIGETSRYCYNDAESVNRIDVIDISCEEYAQEVLGFSDSSTSGNPTLSLDPILSTSFPSLAPFEGGDFILKKLKLAFTNNSISPELICRL